MDFIDKLIENYPKLCGFLFLILAIGICYYNIYEIKSTREENKTSWYLSSIFKGWALAFIFFMLSFFCFFKL